MTPLIAALAASTARARDSITRADQLLAIDEADMDHNTRFIPQPAAGSSDDPRSSTPLPPVVRRFGK